MKAGRIARVAGILVILITVIGQMFPVRPVQAAAALTITPITWNVIGLDSNNVNVGPNDFPVGVQVCNAGTTDTVTTTFAWTSADASPDPLNPYIALRPNTSSAYSLSIANGACKDFYFEVEILRNSAAYNKTRRYTITASAPGATSAVTPIPREILVERLVSQNRNSVTGVNLNGAPVAVGGTMDLQVGGTYDITLVGGTSTNGYNQLESFINLPNTIFRVNSVSSTYNVTNLGSPYPRLYADSCTWDNNPLSATYRSCIGSDGKTGGDVTTNFNVTIISGGGTTQTLNTLLYDFSGSSYHYNSDFSTSARYMAISNLALTFSKAFSAAFMTPGSTNTLTFTITNPTGASVSGVSFSDPLPQTPGSMKVANTTVSTTGCGTPTFAPAANDTTLTFSNGTISAGGTCTVTVNVTATTTGTYTNTAGPLNANGADIGLYAVATINVATAGSDPGTGFCGRILANWGFATSVSPDAGYPGDVGTPTIATGTGNTKLTFSQASSGFPVLGGASATSPGLKVSGYPKSTVDPQGYLEFALNLTNYKKINFAFTEATILKSGSLNGPIYYDVQAGTNTAGTYSGASIATYTPDATGLWQTHTAPVQFSTGGSSTSVFRIYGYGSNNQGVDAAGWMDNISLTGCLAAEPVDPTMTKTFSPNPVVVGATSTVTFTLSNSNTTALTGTAFSDTLPTGMKVAANPNIQTTCSPATVTAAADSSLISVSNTTVPVSSSCTIQVNVTASSSGALQNVTGYLATTEGGSSSNYASGTLNVYPQPGFTKEFTTNPIYVGGSTPLVFKITNPSTSAISGVAFTDTLPGALLNTTPAASHSGCSNSTTPTLTAAADTNTISFSNGSIAAGGTCTVTVNVKAPLASSTGNFLNTSSTLTTSQAGVWAAAATDTLAVIPHYPGLKLTKQISDSASGPWTSFITAAPGSDIYYRLTLENTGDVNLTSTRVTDPTLSLATCALSTPFTLEVASPSVEPSTCVIGPVLAQAGDTLNRAVAQGTYNSTDYTSSSTAEYVGALMSPSAPGISLEKQISTSASGPWSSSITGVVAPAGVYYKFTIVNTGNAELNTLSISDALVSTTSCEFTSPLAIGAATACVVGPVASTSGIYTNTAHAVSASPALSSADSSASYTAGSLSISGTTWIDPDTDGVIDGGETRLFNAVLDLYLDSGNGTFSLAEETFLGTAYSDANGDYTFSSLPAGSYWVVASGGASGYYYVSGGTNPRYLTISSNSSGNNFGFAPVDLQISKTNSTAGAVKVGSNFIWTLTISNAGSIGATFSSGQTIVSDPPLTRVFYSNPTAGAFNNITNSGNIACTISSDAVICTASGGPVTIGAGGSFNVSFLAVTTLAGDKTNTATVDPDGVIAETNELNNADSDTVTASNLTGVNIVNFAATSPAFYTARVSWTTVVELDNIGFNTYRSLSASGPWEKVNPQLIPARTPGALEGSQYDLLDKTILPGVQYFYRLEAIDAQLGAQSCGVTDFTQYLSYIPFSGR